MEMVGKRAGISGEEERAPLLHHVMRKKKGVNRAFSKRLEKGGEELEFRKKREKMDLAKSNKKEEKWG